MPIYEFNCSLCKQNFESIIMPWDPARCPHCGCVECDQVWRAPNLIGLSAESKEMARREGKRERVTAMIEREAGKKIT